MGVLGASLFLLPGLGPYNWAAIGLLSVSAVLAGTRRYAAARPLPWRMLAGALLASAVGDTIFGVTVHSGTDILPLPADLAYLLMFPLITIGMIQMARSNVVIEWSRVIDVLVFTCAAALLAWVYLVAPTLSAAQLDSLDRSTMGAYTLGDLVVLILSVRLVIAARRSPAIILLAIGALAVLVADVTYTLIQMSGGWRPGDADDLLYFVFYATWGAAALQPSMAHLTVPMPTRYAQLPMRWASRSRYPRWFCWSNRSRVRCTTSPSSRSPRSSCRRWSSPGWRWPWPSTAGRWPGNGRCARRAAGWSARPARSRSASRSGRRSASWCRPA
jgi:hypothetical protein